MKHVTINNGHIGLTVLDYGAIIQKLEVPDKNGNKINTVVSLHRPQDYLGDNYFLGACIGRFSGRITNGRFVMDNTEYTLHSENGVHLHGGKEGFSKKYWTFEAVNHGTDPFVRLSYLSHHMDEGYPGSLKVTVTYKLIGSSLYIDHKATTDKKTIVNLTNHSYFNLDGASSIDHYHLQLDCSRAIEVQNNLLPTGQLNKVENTAFDFTKRRKIGAVFLDTPYAIDGTTEKAASVYSEKSGICMDVYTDQPAMVVYTPKHFAAICFETQNYPDAPNHANFPSCQLKPMEVYQNMTEFRFSAPYFESS